MKRITLLAACAAATAAWAQDDDVRALPLSMITQVDAGQIVKGASTAAGTESGVDKSFLQRTSVWITQEIAVGQRLDVRAGIGGLFWYPIPGFASGISEAGRFQSLTRFGPGITRADMVYRFGDPADPRFTLQAGFFPYKYKPDAKNLGEYLLRSGAYPGYLTTGGWNILSEAGYMMQGVRLNMSLWGGKFQSEFLLPMERDIPPTGDLSPTYIATLRPVNGIEVGGGVACHHCIAVKPSVTSPERKYSSMSTELDKYGYGSGIIIENPNYIASPNDSLKTGLAGSNPKYIYDTTDFYTFQGIKLMARASFDPKAFIPMPFLGPADLKVFGEVALLGVKDYPFYYEDKTERMPVMVGINLPAFRFLDVVSFQMEYYNSPFPNSIDNAYRYQMPTFPFVNETGVQERDPNFFDPDNREVTRDNWKWSLFAKKRVTRGLNLYAQVANDHLRLPTWTVEHSPTPITTIQGEDWYYLIRLELGI